ncbi:Ig-like domain repeat protein [Pseudomonas sp. RA_35y_Pfl2_P32]|uniref:Ig-like domain repeat protein n=1 Tax=Pseudomonas sp. RA_35y_Pfl2_P32 TaxID=3088705 RepID=UPI0030DA8F77
MSRHRPFLFPPLDDIVSPLALRPLSISNMSRPIVDGDGGINITVVTEYPEGALCSINPYGEMAEGDKINVFLDKNPAVGLEVQAQDVNQRLYFYIPAELFTPGWVEECYYELQRKSEPAPDDPSAPLRLLTKLDLPGGIDKWPPGPGHSELKIVQLPEEVIRQGVDAEWAAKGVPMTILHYPNIALRDTIQVAWGSVWLPPHLVTQAQLDGTEPIVIIADLAAILAAGDSDALNIDYELHDEVWNYSVRWSLPTTVKVDAGAWKLDAPIIKEAVNGVIDLKQLNQQDVTVQVIILAGDFEENDRITLTWIGTPPIGKPLIYNATFDIYSIPSVHEFKVPYAEVRAIAMGKADAAYVLTKADGGPTLSSKHAFTHVIGDVYAHPAPTIRELVGQLLEPDCPMATIDIHYPGMADGDFINLIWMGKRSDGTPYVHEQHYLVSEGDAERKTITIYVMSEHISVLVNGTLDLYYVVSNDQAALYGVSESEHLLVDVRAIRVTLPAPEVEEADDDVLDPSKVFDNAHVLIKYLGTVKDDILTYYWTSANPFASTSDWLPITSVTAGKPVRFRVSADYVSANIGQYVKVRYTLKHAATGLYSYSGTLNLMVGYLVGELPPPEVIQAQGDAPSVTLDPMQALGGVDIQAGYASMDPELDIIGLKWLGVPGAGTSEDLELPGHASKTVLFHLPAPFVGANINKMVSVNYGVQRYGYITSSETLSVRVLAFEDPENELPTPEVPQALDNVLDLTTFTGNADVTVKAWPHIALKQRAWLRLEGKTSAGGDYRIEPLKGEEITQTHLINGLNEILPRTELLKLGHTSPATVVCKVTFDGSTDENMAIDLPVLPLTIRTRYDYLTPVIETVRDSRGEVVEGGITRDKEVTLHGRATREQKVELFDETSQSLGIATVGIDWMWQHEIRNLTEKTWRITAKALYDADPVSSAPRTFTVDFAVTPDITSITDSKGEVEPGGTTYDNSVFVQGDATPDEQVRLLDGTTPIITLNVGNDGKWNHRLNNLGVRTYTLRVEALYDVEPTTSPPRSFIVAQAVTPTISSVTDIRGTVNNNGTTYYRSVTLGGKASPNEQIELRDGNTPIQTIDVRADGNWDYPFNSLTLKTYSLTVKGLYGSEPISSPPRIFTVAAHISPTISSVHDADGTPVDAGATTYTTRVTVRGRATPREQVEIYDGSQRISPLPVEDNGNWTLPLNVVTKAYSITAHALYDVTPISSPARTFTVAAHVGPTLDSVIAAGAELPEGGSTIATSVALRGQVTPNHEVQIRDNGNAKHTVRANGTDWSTTLAVGVGGHRITAIALATGRESNSRGFTVRSPIPPLAINTGHVSLSAWIFRSDATPTNPPSGAFIDRHASGGVPPYRYASSNPAIAEVNSSTGRVISKGNGSAQITVYDNANQSASYPVSVSNVHRIFGTGAFSTYTQCHNAAVNQGGRIPSLAEWRSLIALGGPTESAWCWAADSAGFAKRWAIHPASGQAKALKDLGFGGDTANGFGIRGG